MPTTQPRAQTIADIQKCVGVLKDLELRWSGASCSRAIIEQLLAEFCNDADLVADPQHRTQGRSGAAQEQLAASNHTINNKRPFAGFEDEGAGEAEGEAFWNQIPHVSELFTFDSMDPGLFNSWSGL